MFAFDYGGTLQNHPALCDMVALCNAHGLPVFCLSIISEAKWANTRYREILALRTSSGQEIRFEGMFAIAAHTTEDAAVAKLHLMRATNCKALWDDNEYIRRFVAAAHRGAYHPEHTLTLPEIQALVPNPFELAVSEACAPGTPRSYTNRPTPPKALP
jgi:hypothetical protein